MRTLDEIKERAVHLSATSPEDSLAAAVAADALALILTLRGVLERAEQIEAERDIYQQRVAGVALLHDCDGDPRPRCRAGHASGVGWTMRYRIMTTSPAGHVFVSHQMYDTRKSALAEIAKLRKTPGWTECEFRVVSA